MSHTSQPAPVEVMVADNPAEALGAAISDLFERSPGNEILFLVAGGSSLAVLEHIVDDNISSQMTVVVTDERVSDDLDINNYAKLQATSFWNKLVANDAYSIPTELLGRDSKELSDAFDAALKRWRADFPKGLVVGLYGIGKDGHTAGIFPGMYSKKDFDTRYLGDRYVEEFETLGMQGVDSGGGDFPFRVTTTLSFMRDIVDVGYFFAQGESKAKALKATLSADGTIYETPARIMHEMRKAFVFTDIL